MLSIKKEKRLLFLFMIFIMYQFIMGILFLKYTALYLLASPYIVLSFAFFMLLINMVFNKKIEEKSFIFLFLFSIIVIVGFFKYFTFAQFPLNYIKSLQYFYGVIIVIFGVKFILKNSQCSRKELSFLYEKVIIYTLMVFSLVTILEFIYHNVLMFPWEYLGHIPNIENEYHPDEIIKIRPFGIASYPQPNGVMLSGLVYLYILMKKRIDFIFILGSLALFLTFTGTGILVFFMLLPLFIKHTFKAAFITFIGLIIMSFVLIKVSFLYPELSIFQRLSANQFSAYFDIFIHATYEKYMIYFDFMEYLFGSHVPNFNVGTGITHDWAYFDVIYEYGFVGLSVYIIIYSMVIYGATNLFASQNKRIYFTLMMLVANAHYPTINFYSAQLLFGILFALNLMYFRTTNVKV